jgi:hypothetical protein
MATYNYLQAWFLSFYSKKLYLAVGQRWRGTGLLYLFTLLMVCLAISSIQMQKFINDFVVNIAPPIVAKLPEMEIKQGLLTAKVSMPYIIQDAKTNKRIAVIDTSGKIDDLAQAEAPVLITQKAATYGNMPNGVAKLSFEKLPDMKINQAKLNNILLEIKQKAIYYLYALSMLYYFIIALFLLGLFSIFAVIIVKQLHIALPYKSLFRLTTVAATPIIIIGLLVNLFAIPLPYPLISFFFLTIAYIYFAIRANKPIEPVAVNPV